MHINCPKSGPSIFLSVAFFAMQEFDKIKRVFDSGSAYEAKESCKALFYRKRTRKAVEESYQLAQVWGALYTRSPCLVSAMQQSILSYFLASLMLLINIASRCDARQIYSSCANGRSSSFQTSSHFLILLAYYCAFLLYVLLLLARLECRRPPPPSFSLRHRP